MVLGSTQPLTEPGAKGGRCVRLTNYHHPVPLSRNLGTLTSWNPLGLSRPVTGLLYLYLYPFLKHPQRCEIRGAASSVAEDVFSGVWCFVDWHVRFRRTSAFVFRVKQTLVGLADPEDGGTTLKSGRRKILEHLNPQIFGLQSQQDSLPCHFYLTHLRTDLVLLRSYCSYLWLWIYVWCRNQILPHVLLAYLDPHILFRGLVVYSWQLFSVPPFCLSILPDVSCGLLSTVC